MGCDIHAHAEIKVNNKWHHYNHPNIQRYYALFNEMAGVRGDKKITPKGLPKGLSFTTKLDRKRWGVNGHSDSWLSRKEMASLCKWFEEEHKKYNPDEYFYAESVFGYLLGNGWETLPNEIQDARLVFWFDN